MFFLVYFVNYIEAYIDNWIDSNGLAFRMFPLYCNAICEKTTERERERERAAGVGRKWRNMLPHYFKRASEGKGRGEVKAHIYIFNLPFLIIQDWQKKKKRLYSLEDAFWSSCTPIFSFSFSLSLFLSLAFSVTLSLSLSLFIIKEESCYMYSHVLLRRNIFPRKVNVISFLR